jgi:peptidoglycan/LPS O-acetylase OafA/YrhL
MLKLFAGMIPLIVDAIETIMKLGYRGILAMQTIGERLERNRGIGPGFDFLRVALAMLVVFNHSFLLLDGNFDYINRHGLSYLFGVVVPMFFALSGFLISGSAQRLKLKDFLLNRSMRIVPALAVDIAVSALILGPLFTTLSLHDYFTGQDFQAYFANIIGFIHYTLPGVFAENPFADRVNGSLWTVPYEIGCYILMSLLIFTGSIKSKPQIVFFCVFFTVIFCSLHVYYDSHPSPFAAGSVLGNYLGNFVELQGSVVYFNFLAGVVVFVFRDSIPYSGKLALASIATIVFSEFVHDLYFFTLAIAYLTVYVGLLDIPKMPLYSRGDYSYGIYLYAFPIQQALLCLFPGKFTVITHFLLSTALVTGVAMFSWHCIEKPVLSLRKKFSFTARKGDAVPQPALVQPVTEPAAAPVVTP